MTDWLQQRADRARLAAQNVAQKEQHKNELRAQAEVHAEAMRNQRRKLLLTETHKRTTAVAAAESAGKCRSSCIQLIVTAAQTQAVREREHAQELEQLKREHADRAQMQARGPH